MIKKKGLLQKLAGLVMAFAVILTFTACSSVAESEVVIVSMNSQEVLQAHPAMQKAQKEYRAKMEEKQEEIGAMEEDQQRMARQMMQQELQQLGQELQQDAVDAMNKDISKVAKKKGYDYVLDSSVIFYGAKDVTGEMIKAVEK
ncbi:MAG: OmpH family outer membrane protein [Elusimicrobiota bacterium]|nr:OmpH family outer membrane protein [Elusimicrobiota bacterium]